MVFASRWAVDGSRAVVVRSEAGGATERVVYASDRVMDRSRDVVLRSEVVGARGSGEVICEVADDVSRSERGTAGCVANWDTVGDDERRVDRL